MAVIDIKLGDCLQGLRQLSDKSIDCVITSPPYKTADGYSEQFIVDVFTECMRVMKDNTLCFINFGHLAEQKSRPFSLVLLLENKVGLKLQETFTWLKNHTRPIQGNTRVNNLTEFIFMFSKGDMPALDRMSIGVPYIDQNNSKRYNKHGLKCAGNVIITDEDEPLKFDPSQFYHNRQYVVDEQIFANIDNSEKSYLLGFVWADGYLNSKINRLQIGLSSKDTLHLIKLRKILQSNHPIRLRQYFAFGKDRENCILNITSKTLAQHLVNTGFLNKKIPIGIPRELESDFIRGVFDGDGSMGLHQSGPLMYFLGEPELLEWIRASIQNHTGELIPGKLVNKGKICKLQIAGKKVQYIVDWMYKDSAIFLDRKADKWSTILSSNQIWWMPYETITANSKKLHNDRFPLELPTKCLKLSHMPNLVCDPFVGSGTTALACKNMGLNFIGWELNPMHYQTALQRVQ